MPAGPAVYNLADPETRLNWERELYTEVAKRTFLMNPAQGLVGDDETNVVQRKKKVFEEGGSRATLILDRNLRQSPSFGNTPLRDREEGLRTSTFNFEINQVRHAVAVAGRMSQQRVPFDLWKRSLRRLGEYWPQIMEACAFLHAAGIPYDISTAAEWYHKGNDLGHTFSNVPTVADTKHIYRVNEHASDDLVGADPSAIFDTNICATLVAYAKTLPVPIRPAMIHGQELYLFVMHPYQTRQLKNNSRWMALMRDTIKGGAINGNPVWTGAMGIVDGVLLCESPYIPCGIDGSNVRVANCRRGVFMGAQGLTLGLAKDYEDENTFKNEQESWDYANNKGIAANILAGMAKPRFVIDEQGTTEDYATIVVPSYAKELWTSA